MRCVPVPLKSLSGYSGSMASSDSADHYYIIRTSVRPDGSSFGLFAYLMMVFVFDFILSESLKVF